MKRKVLLLALLVTTIGTMAQTKSADSTRLVLDHNLGRNWFVSVGGGAQMYFGEYNKQMKFTACG